MKTLFIVQKERDVTRSDDYFRINNTIKTLEQLTELHIISLNPRKIISAEKIQTSPFSFYKKFLQGHAQFIVNYARKHGIPLVWFNDGQFCYRLIQQVRARNKALRIISETKSVRSRELFRQLPFKASKEKENKLIAQVFKQEAQEKSLVSFCDVITASSENEAIYYRNLTLHKEKIALFSEVIDVEHYQKVPKQTLKEPALYVMDFYRLKSDNMSWSAKWFLEEVLPLVRKRYPTVHCYIHCKDFDRTVETEHLSFIGKNSSEITYLKNSDIALNPLHFEPGNVLNLLQAAACKIPIVSTTIGAIGLPLRENEHIMIADTAEEFASAIVKLIEDKPFARYIAEKCYQLANDEFGLDRLKNETKEILSRITL